MIKGYKKLQIYQEAHNLAIQIHSMSLGLPSLERFEESSQIRRSSKSISANIVEGFALRRYKNEFIHYLFRAYASGEETIEHLELLYDTKSLDDEVAFMNLHKSYDILCGKLLRFIQAVDRTFDIPNFIKDSNPAKGSFAQNPNPKTRNPL